MLKTTVSDASIILTDERIFFVPKNKNVIIITAKKTNIIRAYVKSWLGGKFFTIPKASEKSDISPGIKGSCLKTIFSLFTTEPIINKAPEIDIENKALFVTKNTKARSSATGTALRIKTKLVFVIKAKLVLKEFGSAIITAKFINKQAITKRIIEMLIGISIFFDLIKS